jgi:hypothetical protein
MQIVQDDKPDKVHLLHAVNTPELQLCVLETMTRRCAVDSSEFWTWDTWDMQSEKAALV